MEGNGVVEEVLALKAIYFRELEVTNNESTNVPTRVSINLHPATADNALEQFVCLTLVINLPPNYPNDLPEIVIRNPRGLSDEDFERIKNDLQTKANESQGNAMLYELIEIAKEHLTLGNTPRCACAICLYGFTDADVFTKTCCYHYFHSHCLARYVEYVIHAPVASNPLAEQTDLETVKVLCPVCREPIAYDLESLKAPPPPLQSESAAPFELDSELVKLQQQMSELFDKQKSQGGIIDVEAEKNKYLLEISTAPADLDVVLSEANVRSDAKSTNHKANRKEQQQQQQRPRGSWPQRDDQRRTQREPKRYPPGKDESAVGENGAADDRQATAANRPNNRRGHNRGRGGGGGYQANRWAEGGAAQRGYPNRGSRGRGYSEQRWNADPQNERNSSDGLGATPQHRPSNNSAPFRPDGSSYSNYRRPNYGQRGRSGRWRDERHREEQEKAEENGKDGEQSVEAPPAHPKRMDWAEQVGEDEVQQQQQQAESRQRRWRNHNGRSEESHEVSEGGPPMGRDPAFRKRNNDNYRGYRGGNSRSPRWNRTPTERAAGERSTPDPVAKASAETCADKPSGGGCGSGSDSIPVSRFMVLTGPPTKSFADSVNPCNGGAERKPRPPPGFTQCQPQKTDSCKAFSGTLPPGFKTRPEIAAPPGFEAKM